MKKAFSARAASVPSAIVAIAAFAAWIQSGCESAETHGVEISVSKREVTAVGETVALSASGWNEYSWSLSDTSIGRLSSPKGRDVVYTVLEIPATNSTHVLQTVTCQTTDTGSAGGAYGTVEIRHMSPGGSPGEATSPVDTATDAPSPGSSSSGGSSSGGSSSGGSSSGGSQSSAAPRLSQTSITVDVGPSTVTVVPISVENPVADHVYRWTVSPSGSGRVSPASGTSVTYYPPSSESYRGRTASIRCTDSATGLSSTCAVSFE